MLGAAAALVAALAATACTSPPRPPAPSAPAPQRPLWTTRLPDGAGRPELAQATGEHIVVLARQSLVVLDRRTGAVRWQHRRPEASRHHGVPVHVTGDALVTFDGHPSVVATVYDLATGTRRYDVPGDSVMPTRDGLVVATCPVRGPCELSARDLRTGDRRWRVVLPFAEAGFVLPHRPDRTLGESWPLGNPAEDLVEPMRAVDGGPVVARGTDGTWTVHSGTGAVMARWRAPTLHEAGFFVGDLLVNPADWRHPGTDTAVYDVRTGRLRWSHPLGRKAWRAGTPGGLDTTSHDPAMVDTAILSMTADDRPQVTDVGSGAVRWTGDEGTILLGLDGPTAVARDRGGLGDLVGLDAATGVPRWRVPLRGYQLHAWAAVGGRLLHSGRAGPGGPDSGRATPGGPDDPPGVAAVDLATGRPLWTAAGAGDLIGAGADWVVAATATSVALY